MKKPFFLLLLLAVASTIFAQSVPTTISYNKKDQSALMIELPYTQEIAESFLVSKLEHTGYMPEKSGNLFWKQSKVNGFYVFKGVQLKGAPAPMDLYFKVVQKSKLNKGASIIFMILSKGGEQFISPSGAPENFAAAAAFMNSFDKASAAYKLHLDVKDEEAGLQDAQARLLKLKEEEVALQQQLEALEAELKANREHQASQGKAIEHARTKLAALKEKALQP